MTTLRLRVPGLPSTLERSLDAGGALLVGRRPDARLLPAEVRARAGAVELVAVASTAVSEQHCVVWREGASVHVRDLRSTNGTRWVLPAGASVAAAVDVVSLELAPSVDDDEPPANAVWSDGPSFREGVRDAVGAWLDARGVACEARVRPLEGEGGGEAIPLGDGWGLALDARRTAGGATRDVRLDRLLPRVWSYVRAQRGAFEVDRDSARDHGELVLASPAIRALHRRITQAAQRGLNGVLLGESGVGKSALARCFHLHAERRDGPYVETNLAEDSDDRKYFQLKLFGARAGASSGITRDQVGLVQAAHGGTLFLDEVGQLPLDVQGMLLRFLDRGAFRRLGEPGDAPERRADVRVVVGDNSDLRERVRAGTFREDLWWRLSGIVLDVPPLRERREDVEALLRREPVTLAGRTAPLFDMLTPEARRFLLESYPWRGNLRELRNFVARVSLYADERAEVDVDVCAAALAGGSLAPPARPPSAAPAPAIDDGWADLMPLARRLLPAWLAQDPSRRAGAATDLKALLDEVLRPLCVARALGVEAWEEVPRRPTPSFQAMADALGYADGRSVQAILTRYVELRRLAAAQGLAPR